MSPRRSNDHSSALPILIAMLSLAVLLGGYPAGYVGLSEAKDWRNVTDHQLFEVQRIYRHRGLATVFAPAAQIEALVRGVRVSTKYEPPERGQKAIRLSPLHAASSAPW